MPADERNAQARHFMYDPFAPPLAPHGSSQGDALVKANPDCLDPKRQRSELQLIVMRFNWRGDLNPDQPAISEYGNAVGLRLWETLHTSDWAAIAGALGRQ